MLNKFIPEKRDFNEKFIRILKDSYYLFLRGSHASPYRKGSVDFIFIHINKTAGTSLYRTLGIPWKRHLTSQEVIDIVGQEKWQKAFKFAFVRNPWDKVVSQYKYRIKTNQNRMKENEIDFNNWVIKAYKEKDLRYFDLPKLFAPQAEWLKNNEGKIDMDFIGRFENLHNDFEKVSKELKLQKELPHLNKTNHKPYQDYYNKDSINIIENHYKEDIEMFGYKFE